VTFAQPFRHSPQVMAVESGREENHPAKRIAEREGI
jgi:hypothetical protein